MRIGRFLVVAMAGMGLSACGFLPPTGPQDFTVTAVQPADQPGSSDAVAALNDQQARLVCAEGYEKVKDDTQPADPGSFVVWQVRCLPIVHPDVTNLDYLERTVDIKKTDY
jgi:hypothetical protein